MEVTRKRGTHPDAKDGRSDYRHDPMDPRERRPCEPEQPNRHKGRADNDRRQSIFRLTLALHTCDPSVPLNEPHPDLDPHTAHHRAREHAQKHAQKGESRLPQVKSIHALKDKGEGAKEEVKNAKENGGVKIEDQSHGLEGENLEWSEERVADGAKDGLARFLDGGFPAIVAGFFSDALGFFSEDNGVYRMISRNPLQQQPNAQVPSGQLFGSTYGRSQAREKRWPRTSSSPI